MINKLKLADVVISQKGIKPSFLRKKPFPSSIPYLDINALENNENREYTYKELGTNSEINDVLVVWDGSRSGLVLKGREGVIGSTIMKLIPIGLDKEYLFYFIKSKFDLINLNKIGSGIPHVDPNIIFNLEIPFLKIEKQQKLVAQLKSKLELNTKLLQQQKNAITGMLKTTKIDFYIDEDVHRTIQNFKKAVINSAATGTLTKSWRKENKTSDSIEKLFNDINLEKDKYHRKATEEAIKSGFRPPKNAKDNKKSINDYQLFDNIPSTWGTYRLEDICYLVTDGTHHKPKYQKDGIKFLSVKNVRPFLIKDEDVKYISADEHAKLIRRCNPENGDILYTKIGATFGYAAVVNLNYDFSIFVSLALIKPVQKLINSEFLELVMNSEFVFNQARQRITGVANPDLHLIEIRDFKIPLTNIEEQEEIVKRVKPLLNLAEKIEATFLQSLQDYSDLEKSILSEAFEKIMPENNDNYIEFLKDLSVQKQKTEEQLKEIKKQQSIFRKTNFMQNTLSNIGEAIKNLILKKYAKAEITKEIKLEIRETIENLIPEMDYDDFSDAFQLLIQDKIKSDEAEPFLLSGKKDGKLYHFLNSAYETPIS